MDDIEIIEDVKPIKKGNKKIIIIIVLIIICLLTGIGVFYFINNNKTTNEVVPEVKKEEIPAEVKFELLKIIGLSEDGHSLLSEEEIKNLGLESKNYMNLTSNDLLTTFINLDVDKDIIINELSDYYKKEIVFKYANTYKMIDIDNCSFYIDKELNDKIIKLYGIDLIKYDDSEIDGERYNYNLSCSQTKNITKIDDSIEFSKENDSIIITYKAILNDDIKKTIKFTFNQKDDESYYLYKVNVKND